MKASSEHTCDLKICRKEKKTKPFLSTFGYNYRANLHGRQALNHPAPTGRSQTDLLTIRGFRCVSLLAKLKIKLT